MGGYTRARSGYEKHHGRNEDSEGTVVAFKGLATALAAQKNPDNEWVDRVKGFMTIGSPLNKHIVMWPGLWQGLKPAPDRTGKDPIPWRNYYDYGDPVDFNLEITREWMKKNRWLSCFQFGDDDDCGFTRYPFPGKAHNDYWNDDKVGCLGHHLPVSWGDCIQPDAST